MPTSIRILIAEDHTMLADALKLLLQTQPDMQCIGIANDGESALALTTELRPDVLLLDLGLPGIDGLAVIKNLQTMHLPPHILVITARIDANSVRAALALGATGYLPKDESSRELLLAIRRVAQGLRYISSDIASLFIDSTESGTLNAQLTKSEAKILQLVSTGLTSKEIAIQLEISEGTVRKHRENLRKKLGVRNTAEMAHFALHTQNTP